MQTFLPYVNFVRSAQAIHTTMKVEKNCKIHTRPKERKWLKRLSSRLMRRLAKLLMEDAPTKLRHITRGWSD